MTESWKLSDPVWLREQYDRQRAAAVELGKLLAGLNLDLSVAIRALRLHGEDKLAERLQAWSKRLPE